MEWLVATRGVVTQMSCHARAARQESQSTRQEGTLVYLQARQQV